jgi:hypothetical protein
MKRCEGASGADSETSYARTIYNSVDTGIENDQGSESPDV